MKKVLIALSALIFIVVIIIVAFILVKFFRPKSAGLFIDSVPASKVYVNGVEVGTTPYNNKSLTPGEYSIRLSPSEAGLLSFDTRIKLAANIETVLRHSFASSQEYSSTEMISFEPTNKNESEINIITMPTNAEVLIDDQIRGFTPYNSSSTQAGSHKIAISLSGYAKKDVSFKTHMGFKLIAYIALAKDQNDVVSPTPTPTPSWFIEIMDTPTGFLRVRKEPSTVGVEVGQVKPGEKYRLLEENTQTGWFRIEYKSGIPGWISNQFAKKVLTSSPDNSELSVPTLSTPSANGAN